MSSSFLRCSITSVMMPLAVTTSYTGYESGHFGGAGGTLSGTCTHAYHMSKMVQIRNVPETLHRKLKVRAADAGQTLSDYLLAELERLAARPTRDEMLARLHGRKRVTLKTPAGVVVRDERESA